MGIGDPRRPEQGQLQKEHEESHCEDELPSRSSRLTGLGDGPFTQDRCIPGVELTASAPCSCGEADVVIILRESGQEPQGDSGVSVDVQFIEELQDSCSGWLPSKG